MKSHFLANLTRWIHLLMFVVVIAGPFLPRRLLPYYILFIFVIFLDWNDVDGMCILTKIEHYFRTGMWESTSPVEGGPEFFRPMLQVFGISLSRTEADRLNNFIFIICCMIAFIRYVWFSSLQK
jgi:hypothetical protein